MGIWLPAGYRNPLAYPAGVAPGFDPSHVAAPGCRVAAVMLAGRPVNLLTGAASAVSGATFVMEAIGPCLVTTSGQQGTFTTVAAGTATPQTYMAIFRPTSVGGFQYACGIGSGNGSGMGINVSSQLIFARFGGTSYQPGGYTFLANVPYFMIGSTDNASKTNVVVVRLDTGAMLTFSGAGSAITASNTSFYFGAGNLNSAIEGRTHSASYSEVFLSLLQCVQAAADPWAFWYPPRRRYYVGLYPAVGIAFDAASNSTYQTADASYTWNHTCTGSNRYLTVGISMLSVAGSSVSSITYNGVAMSLIDAKASVSGAVRSELWGLVAPASGTNVISVTLSASLDSIGGAVSFTGVNQSLPYEGVADASATNVGAADATVNVTTVADNDWCVDVVASDDTAITVGAGQTSRNNVSGTLGSGAMSTEGPQTPAGSVTMSWTNVAALATWSIVSVALRPVAASGAGGFGALLSDHRFRLIRGGLALS